MTNGLRLWFQIMASWLFFLWMPLPLAAQVDAALRLIELSRIKNLSDSPVWHALLHYKKNTLAGGFTSYADDPSFFLSKEGRTSPKEELEAAITAFFDTGSREPWGMPIRCVFVARYEWLKESLSPHSFSIPDPACPVFDEWFGLIAPERLTLVFASSYMNNPASAFGHTFLRLDQEGQTEKNRLLAYTANYSADAIDANALLYATKGIFGGYNGYFTVAPYYEKVRMYGDIEHRDLWEYELSLAKPEVERVVKHLWELRNIGFDYYYFDENCSFQLLSLLEVARPDLDLTDSFYGWVVPVDTLRRVTQCKGLVTRTVYRPSAETVLRYRIRQSPKEEQLFAKEITRDIAVSTEDDFERIQPGEKARSLDLAYEYLDYSIQSTSGRKPAEEDRAVQILQKRSALTASEPVSFPPQPEVPPEAGHHGARIQLNGGALDGRSFMGLEFQPTFHNLEDPAEGFLKGAQIKGLTTDLRLVGTEGVKLQKFTVLELVSLTPRDRFLKPWSWEFHLVTSRDITADNESHYATRLGTSGGSTVEISEKLWGYVLLSPELEHAPYLDPEFSFGAGHTGGLLYDFNRNVSVIATGGFRKFFAGDNHSESSLAVQARLTLDADTALYSRFERVWLANHYLNEFSAGLAWFF